MDNRNVKCSDDEEVRRIMLRMPYKDVQSMAADRSLPANLRKDDIVTLISLHDTGQMAAMASALSDMRKCRRLKRKAAMKASRSRGGGSTTTAEADSASMTGDFEEEEDEDDNEEADSDEEPTKRRRVLENSDTRLFGGDEDLPLVPSYQPSRKRSSRPPASPWTSNRGAVRSSKSSKKNTGHTYACMVSPSSTVEVLSPRPYCFSPLAPRPSASRVPTYDVAADRSAFQGPCCDQFRGAALGLQDGSGSWRRQQPVEGNYVESHSSRGLDSSSGTAKLSQLLDSVPHPPNVPQLLSTMDSQPSSASQHLTPMDSTLPLPSTMDSIPQPPGVPQFLSSVDAAPVNSVPQPPSVSRLLSTVNSIPQQPGVPHLLSTMNSIPQQPGMPHLLSTMNSIPQPPSVVQLLSTMDCLSQPPGLSRSPAVAPAPECVPAVSYARRLSLPEWFGGTFAVQHLKGVRRLSSNSVSLDFTMESVQSSSIDLVNLFRPDVSEGYKILPIPPYWKAANTRSVNCYKPPLCPQEISVYFRCMNESFSRRAADIQLGYTGSNPSAFRSASAVSPSPLLSVGLLHQPQHYADPYLLSISRAQKGLMDNHSVVPEYHSLGMHSASEHPTSYNSAYQERSGQNHQGQQKADKDHAYQQQHSSQNQFDQEESHNPAYQQNLNQTARYPAYQENPGQLEQLASQKHAYQQQSGQAHFDELYPAYQEHSGLNPLDHRSTNRHAQLEQREAHYSAHQGHGASHCSAHQGNGASHYPAHPGHAQHSAYEEHSGRVAGQGRMSRPTNSRERHVQAPPLDHQQQQRSFTRPAQTARPSPRQAPQSQQRLHSHRSAQHQQAVQPPLRRAASQHSQSDWTLQRQQSLPGRGPPLWSGGEQSSTQDRRFAKAKQSWNKPPPSPERPRAQQAALKHVPGRLTSQVKASPSVLKRSQPAPIRQQAPVMKKPPPELPFPEFRGQNNELSLPMIVNYLASAEKQVTTPSDRLSSDTISSSQEMGQEHDVHFGAGRRSNRSKQDVSKLLSIRSSPPSISERDWLNKETRSFPEDVGDSLMHLSSLSNKTLAPAPMASPAHSDMHSSVLLDPASGLLLPADSSLTFTPSLYALPDPLLPVEAAGSPGGIGSDLVELRNVCPLSMGAGEPPHVEPLEPMVSCPPQLLAVDEEETAAAVAAITSDLPPSSQSPAPTMSPEESKKVALPAPNAEQPVDAAEEKELPPELQPEGIETNLSVREEDGGEALRPILSREQESAEPDADTSIVDPSGVMLMYDVDDVRDAMEKSLREQMETQEGGDKEERCGAVNPVGTTLLSVSNDEDAVELLERPSQADTVAVSPRSDDIANIGDLRRHNPSSQDTMPVGIEELKLHNPSSQDTIPVGIEELKLHNPSSQDTMPVGIEELKLHNPSSQDTMPVGIEELKLHNPSSQDTMPVGIEELKLHNPSSQDTIPVDVGEQKLHNLSSQDTMPVGIGELKMQNTSNQGNLAVIIGEHSPSSQDTLPCGRTSEEIEQRPPPRQEARSRCSGCGSDEDDDDMSVSSDRPSAEDTLLYLSTSPSQEQTVTGSSDGMASSSRSGSGDDPSSSQASVSGGEVKSSGKSVRAAKTAAKQPRRPVRCSPRQAVRFLAPLRSASALHQQAKNLKPCGNSDVGCDLVLPPAQLSSHELLCQFNTVSCPSPGPSCSWQGAAKKLYAHVKEAHRSSIEIISGSDSKCNLSMYDIYKMEHVFFLKEISRKLFVVGVHSNGPNIYATIQYIASHRTERPVCATGTLEMLLGSGASQHAVWKGKVMPIQQDQTQLLASGSCLEVKVENLDGKEVANITLHVHVHVSHGVAPFKSESTSQ